MALTHISKVFAVTDAKINMVTADVAGSSTTYGASIDLPGVKEVGIEGDVTNKTLRGDNALIDADSVIGALKLKFKWAKLSLDAQAALFGLTVTDAGTTPNQTSTLTFTPSAKPKPFKFSAVSASADPVSGNISLVCYKAVLSKFPPVGMAEEDYATFDAEAVLMPQLGTGTKVFDVAINETALTIP